MAIDTIIKVSASFTAATVVDSAAAVDIPEDGEILGIGASIYGDFAPSPGVFANQTLVVISELSFLSTNQIGVNDSRGSIAGMIAVMVNHFAEAAETGAGSSKFSEMATLAPEGGISVNAGERVHLHMSSSTANLVGASTYYLYMKARGGGRRAPKRR